MAQFHKATFSSQKNGGFSLAELLVALVILGVIATFTIPKILSMGQNNDHKWRVQNAAAIIAGAYAKYQLDNTVTGAFIPSNLTPYMNYVRLVTAGNIDNLHGHAGTSTCNAGTRRCIVLHSGAVIQFYDGESVGSVAPGYAVIFHVDPDGVVTSSGTTNGPGKVVELYLYATNGRIATRGGIDNLTYSCCGSGAAGRAPNPANDPPWFNWN